MIFCVFVFLYNDIVYIYRILAVFDQWEADGELCECVRDGIFILKIGFSIDVFFNLNESGI